MKYPLTDAAKDIGKYLVQEWDQGKVAQRFTFTYSVAGNPRLVHGRISEDFVVPSLDKLMELAKFQLIYLDDINLESRIIEIYSADEGGQIQQTRSIPRWQVLLMQELRNAVESNFEVSDYFLTINAVGTIIQAGASVSAPFQSAAVGYGSLTQTQTVENGQLAEKLIQMLGSQFLESNKEIVTAINQLRESTEADRQSKLGNVISQLGNSLQHGANAFVVSQALVYLAPFVSQIIP